MSGISRDEWLKALGAAVAPPDPDAHTASELAKIFGISRSSMEDKLRELVADKKAIKTVKMIEDINGFRKRVSAFKLVPAKGKRA